MMHNSKSLIRRLAEKIISVDHLNDSVAYRWYLGIRHVQSYKQRRDEEDFYSKLIRRVGSDLVLDIGANEGNKAVIFSRLAERVICFEPSPTSNAALRRRFKSARHVQIIDEGVGATIGSMALNIYETDGPYDTFSEKWMDALKSSDGHYLPRLVPARVQNVPITTLDRIIDDYGLPSYIKVDVEGSEYSVLQGLTKQINAISIECNLPLFEAETLACIDRLIEIHSSGFFNYCATEPPTAFSSKVWLTANQMSNIVRKSGLRFMEIYFIANDEYVQ